jgi:hypothetical protein
MVVVRLEQLLQLITELIRVACSQAINLFDWKKRFFLPFFNGVIMDSKTDENRSVFMKTNKIGLVWFCWLTENRLVEFIFLKKLK